MAMVSYRDKIVVTAFYSTSTASFKEVSSYGVISMALVYNSLGASRYPSKTCPSPLFVLVVLGNLPMLVPV